MTPLIKCEHVDFGYDNQDAVVDVNMEVDAGDYLTETQLLDIAEQDGSHMMSTSGGHYTLPADKDDALLLHEYLDYDPENGMALVADTRWVGFAKGEQ